MPKQKRRRRKEKAKDASPQIGVAFRTTDTGDVVRLNNDTSFIAGAEEGDVYINRQLWEGWVENFDNHVVFGDGASAIHRFYNNAPGRTSDDMAQPGVLAPLGEPSVEIRGNVLVNSDSISTGILIDAGNSTDVQLTNIALNSTSNTATNVRGVRCMASSGTSTGWGPLTARWNLLQDFITQNPSEVPTTRADVIQWLGWEQFARQGLTRHYSFNDSALLPKDPEYRQRRIERQNRRNTAEMRAEQLLWNVLDREQRREWRAHGYFHIQVGPRRYRIEVRKRVANVKLVDSDGIVATYCCHVKDYLPNADNALAQMMMLLHDEVGFLKMANIHYLRDRDGEYTGGRITIDDGGVIYSQQEAA